MTGREWLFFLLGVLVGILGYIIYDFIRGFFKFMSMQKAFENMSGMTFLVEEDENGQPRLVPTKEVDYDAKDGNDSTADNVDEADRNPTGTDESSESAGA